MAENNGAESWNVSLRVHILTKLFSNLSLLSKHLLFKGRVNRPPWNIIVQLFKIFSSKLTGFRVFDHTSTFCCHGNFKGVYI